MDNLGLFQLNWTNLCLTALALWGIYILLHFLNRMLGYSNTQNKYKLTISKGIQQLILMYEPIVILLLLGVFIAINPLLHGFLVGFISLVTYNQIKDYVQGRIFQIDGTITANKQLGTLGMKGIVSKTTRLGIYLKTKDGVHFIPYSKLHSQGFGLMASNQIGGYYNLKISPIEPDSKLNYKEQLIDMLAVCPYLDSSFKTEISPLGERDTAQFNIKVSVIGEQYLYDLIDSINEQGYFCKISKK